MISSQLIKKYDVPAPRYTSYPTVPYWQGDLTSEDWIHSLTETANRPDTCWSLYLHIPYCESLCTFCGCNTTITKDHQREEPYVAKIHQELELYLKSVPALSERKLQELHLGGGTPTFLSAESLSKLLKPFFDKLLLSKDFEASIEIDPRRTTLEQLSVLKNVGFSRVSLGVQDFNEQVQKLVNRIQPFEKTAQVTNWARELGFNSVNFDLIYGLPKQTKELMTITVEKTLSLRPDRIALYSYAHVPWIKPAQRLFTENDLPTGSAKRELYELAREALLKNGYIEIGMDHFALPTDSLSKSLNNQKLHRNFMGYTSHRSDILLGLGVSAISETPGAFHQNEKALPVYERLINEGKLATLRGHKLTPEDRQGREQILNVMTKMNTVLKSKQISDAKIFLKALIDDGLVEIVGDTLTVPEMGRPFLRNICLFFDQRLRQKTPTLQTFSQSI